MSTYTNDEPTVTLTCTDCRGTEYEGVRYTVDLTESIELGETIHPDVLNGEDHENFEVVSTDNLPIDNIDTVAELVDWVDVWNEVSSEDWDAYCAYHNDVAHGSDDPTDASRFRDAFLGRYRDHESFYRDMLAGESDDITEKWAPYIDVVKWGEHEFRYDTFFEKAPGGIFAFRVI